MADEISDPEARGVAERAYQTLVRVGAEGQLDAPKPASKTVRTQIMCSLLNPAHHVHLSDPGSWQVILEENSVLYRTCLCAVCQIMQSYADLGIHVQGHSI